MNAQTNTETNTAKGTTLVLAADSMTCAAMCHQLCQESVPFEFIADGGDGFVAVDAALMPVEKFATMTERANAMVKQGRQMMAALNTARNEAEAASATKN